MNKKETEREREREEERHFSRMSVYRLIQKRTKVDNSWFFWILFIER